MGALRLNEATEKLALAVGGASSDRLAEIFEEIYPEQTAPEVSGSQERDLAARLAGRVRTALEPEEVVDLWNVVFPTHRYVRYDDEQDMLCYQEGEPRYAEWQPL